MAFRFPLESVLRLRQNLEHQQELLLQQANQKVLAITHQIEQLETTNAESAKRQLLQLQSGVSAAELQFDLLCQSMRMQLRHALDRKLAEAQGARDACFENFRQARRRREVVEAVHHNQLQLYRQHEARQNQRRADDLFLLRRAYLQRG
jgi:flagellar export protein FliJ